MKITVKMLGFLGFVFPRESDVAVRTKTFERSDLFRCSDPLAQFSASRALASTSAEGSLWLLLEHLLRYHLRSSVRTWPRAAKRGVGGAG